MPYPLINTCRLSKDYPGVCALDGVDFDLMPGEVHVLFGENGAGKSTLISMLAGATMPSAGEIFLAKKPIKFSGVADAQQHGIYTVFQEFSLIPTLSVAQNIFLGREPCIGLFLDRRTMHRKATEMLEKLGFDIDPSQIVAHLSRAQQQMVEITKAFHGNLRVLILDEPTASLTGKEVDQLFHFVQSLKNSGVGIVYISHRIQEFSRIADRVTVLRDGAKIGTVVMSDASEAILIEMMTGRAMSEIYPKITYAPGEVALQVENLSTLGITNASFTVRAGEVVGVAGLVGSGKSRLFRCIMGLLPRFEGRVQLKTQDISRTSTRKIIQCGMYYLSPDRKSEGLNLAQNADGNLAINLVMAGYAQRTGFFARFFINQSKIVRRIQQITEHIQLRKEYRHKPVSQLSGGNQQKILFGKCFGQDAVVYIFDEPTVGVDVGTRSALYRLIKELAESGKAVVVISSDLPEVMNLVHRLIIMAQGRISAELSGKEICEERVLKHFFEENGVSS